jgi:hypothetical protein
MGWQSARPERLGFRTDDAIGAVLLELLTIPAVDEVKVAGARGLEDQGYALGGALAGADRQGTGRLDRGLGGLWL